MAAPRFDQSQQSLVPRLHAYLASEKRDPRFLKQRLENTTTEGFCHGLASVWLYAMWLSEQPETGKERDDLTFWKKSVEKIATWDMKRPLSNDEKKIFERFLSLIEHYQNFRLIYDSGSQDKFENFFFDSGNRSAQQEYTIAGIFEKKNWEALIKATVQPGRLTFLTVPTHTMAIYLDKHGIYHFYDAGSPIGAVSGNLNSIANSLVTALKRISYPDATPMMIQSFAIQTPKPDSQNKNTTPYTSQKEILSGLAMPANTSWNKMLPIHYAAKIGCVNSFNHWLEQDANAIHAKTPVGETPIDTAVRFGQSKLLESLVMNKNINLLNPTEFEHLKSVALKYHQTEMVNCLFQNAFLAAIQHNDINMLRFTLQHNELNINAQDSHGRTPLYYAIQQGNLQCVELLLQHNADPKVVDNQNQDLIALASRPPANIAVLQKLITATASPQQRHISPFLLAVTLKRPDAVSALMGTEDLNSTNQLGETALIIASKKSAKKTALVLLSEKNINVNIVDNNGRNALMHAVNRGNSDIVAALLKKKKLFINAADVDGHTELMTAVSKGHTDIVKQLLAIPHLQIEVKDKMGQTALDYARAKNNQQIITLLKQHTAQNDREVSLSPPRKVPRLK